MESARFDALTRRLAGTATRRTTLAGLAAALGRLFLPGATAAQPTRPAGPSAAASIRSATSTAAPAPPATTVAVAVRKGPAAARAPASMSAAAVASSARAGRSVGRGAADVQRGRGGVAGGASPTSGVVPGRSGVGSGASGRRPAAEMGSVAQASSAVGVGVAAGRAFSPARTAASRRRPAVGAAWRGMSVERGAAASGPAPGCRRHWDRGDPPPSGSVPTPPSRGRSRSVAA